MNRCCRATFPPPHVPADGGLACRCLSALPVAWVAVAALAGALSGAAHAAADAPSTVVKVCAACHGLDGNSANPDHPRLDGMHAEYLLRQLRAYASGRRRDETMSAIVSGVEASELPALAAYYGSRPPVSRPAPPPSPLAERGKAVYDDGNTASGVPACAGCHQPDGRGNARFPRLAGQSPSYVLRQLQAYKSGRRATDPLMTTVGQRMSADEMQAVAAYIVSLQGN